MCKQTAVNHENMYCCALKEDRRNPLCHVWFIFNTIALLAPVVLLIYLSFLRTDENIMIGIYILIPTTVLAIFVYLVFLNDHCKKHKKFEEELLTGAPGEVSYNHRSDVEEQLESFDITNDINEMMRKKSLKFDEEGQSIKSISQDDLDVEKSPSIAGAEYINNLKIEDAAAEIEGHVEKLTINVAEAGVEEQLKEQEEEQVEDQEEVQVEEQEEEQLEEEEEEQVEEQEADQLEEQEQVDQEEEQAEQEQEQEQVNEQEEKNCRISKIDLIVAKCKEEFTSIKDDAAMEQVEISVI